MMPLTRFKDEYLEQDGFARGQGRRSYGQAQWRKRDGTVVYVLSLVALLDRLGRRDRG